MKNVKKINQGPAIIELKFGESADSNPNFNERDLKRMDTLKKLLPQPKILKIKKNEN